MDELLGAEGRFPGGELGVALIGKVEVVEADLLYDAGAVEDVPHLFRQTTDNEMAPRRMERLVETEDGKAHGSIHVVHIIEPEDNRKRLPVFRNALKSALKHIG